MATFELSEAYPSPAANIPAPPPMVPEEPLYGHGDGIRGRIAMFKGEFDHIYARLPEWRREDPAQVMIEISGYSGRLIGIRAQLTREGGKNADSFRTKELDPLLGQLDFQFKIFSRLITVTDLEFRLSGGGT